VSYAFGLRRVFASSYPAVSGQRRGAIRGNGAASEANGGRLGRSTLRYPTDRVNVLSVDSFIESGTQGGDEQKK